MKKYTKILMFALMVIFIGNTEVSAISLDYDTTLFDNPIKKYRDGEVTNVNAYKMWLEDETGTKQKDAFCVDYGAEIARQDLTPESLVKHFEKGIDSEKAKELVKTLNEYLYFGYGSEGRTSDKYQLATQKLIWEEISKSGFYVSEYYVENIQKLDFTTVDYKYEGEEEYIDLSSEIANINQSISNYYIKPSICSNNFNEEVAVGESITYEDKNGVLSQYEVICDDGLNCTIENNKLIVTGVEEGKNKRIAFSKEGKEADNIMYKTGNYQGVVPVGGGVEPVFCKITVNTFKAPQTSGKKIGLIALVGMSCAIISYIAYTSIQQKKVN